jgi:hypothetical protein
MRHLPLMISKTVVILAMTAVFFGPAGAATKKEAAGDAPPVLLSTKGNAPKWKTIDQLQQFAAQGDPKACFELGARCLEGDEVPQDTPRAISLFERAAKGGVTDATFRLGKIYHDGLGVPVDYVRALDYYTTAAQAGVLEAQHNIGAMLVSARGVKRDFIEGLAWLIVAGKSGDPSDAETQVRNRLAKRPADIKAAEERALEIAKDLRNATVRAVPTGLAVKPTPPAAPKPAVSTPILPPVEKPVITAPKLETPPPVTLIPFEKPTAPTAPGK